jgi:hypothetical protein
MRASQRLGALGRRKAAEHNRLDPALGRIEWGIRGGGGSWRLPASDLMRPERAIVAVWTTKKLVQQSPAARTHRQHPAGTSRSQLLCSPRGTGYGRVTKTRSPPRFPALHRDVQTHIEAAQKRTPWVKRASTVLFAALRTDARIPIAGAGQVKERIWRRRCRHSGEERPARALARSSIALQWLIKVSNGSASPCNKPSVTMAL